MKEFVRGIEAGGSGAAVAVAFLYCFCAPTPDIRARVLFLSYGLSSLTGIIWLILVATGLVASAMIARPTFSVAAGVALASAVLTASIATGSATRWAPVVENAFEGVAWFSLALVIVAGVLLRARRQHLAEVAAGVS